ncbi:hypothetical protein N0824_03999 [Microcystis sp. 0824]|nr:hypothetical protein N0824_03999 [Microcystis sp. 0824]
MHYTLLMHPIRKAIALHQLTPSSPFEFLNSFLYHSRVRVFPVI